MVDQAISEFEVAIIGPGSFYTSLMPPLLVRGMAQALQRMRGPIILVANLLTEGRGMAGFTAGEEVRWIEAAIGRKVDVVVVNTARPSPETLDRYAAEHKHPLSADGIPASCEIVEGPFWAGDIARHARRRLSYAIWSTIAKRLLA